MTTIPTEPLQPRAGVGTPDRKRSSALLRLLARRVHFMAGLLVAPFLAWTTGRPRRCGCASSTATCTWATSVGSIPSPLPAGGRSARHQVAFVVLDGTVNTLRRRRARVSAA